MEITNTLSGLGSIAGFLSFVWLIFEHFNKKPKLEIHACVVTEAVEIGTSKKSNHTKAEIKCALTNIGEKTTYPLSIEFKYAKMTFTANAGYEGFPIVLNSGQYQSFSVQILQKDFGQLQSVSAKDSFGRTYKMDKNRFKILQEHVGMIQDGGMA